MFTTSCVFSFFLVSAVFGHNACDVVENKHVAQNLDNPTWNNEDPYCGYNPDYLSNSNTLKFWNVMNKGLFNENAWDKKWCGMCLKVSKHGVPTPAPYIISKLVDYPTSYDMELQIDTYQSLDLDMNWDTDYVDVIPVVCPIDGDLTRSKLHYEFGGINNYYLEIVVWDHIVPIEFAMVKGLDTSWTYSLNDGWFALTRSTYNEFESNNLPLMKIQWQLKIVSIFGEVVIETFDSSPSSLKNSFQTGTIQFSNIGCMQTVSTSITTTASGTTTTTAATTTSSDTTTTTTAATTTIKASTTTTTSDTTTISSDTTTTAPGTTTSIAAITTTTSSDTTTTNAPSTTTTADISTTDDTGSTADCDEWDIPTYNGQSAVNEDNRNSNNYYCQFKPSFAVNTDVTLLWTGINFNNNLYDEYKDKLCGMCLKVTVGDNEQIVKVAQHSGTSHDMELFPETFESLGGVVSSGLLDDITAVPIVCPIDDIQTRSTLHYQFMSTNKYWFELIVWDHIVPISSVFIKPSNGNQWLETTRTTNNAFKYSPGNGELIKPWDIKIVSMFGEEVSDTITNYPKNSFVAGTAQFSITSNCDLSLSISENSNGAVIISTNAWFVILSTMSIAMLINK